MCGSGLLCISVSDSVLVRYWNRIKAKGIAQLVQHLSAMHEALGSVPSTAKQGMVAHACNASTWEVEAHLPRSSRSPPATQLAEVILGFLRTHHNHKQSLQYWVTQIIQSGWDTQFKTPKPVQILLSILCPSLLLSASWWITALLKRERSNHYVCYSSLSYFPVTKGGDYEKEASFPHLFKTSS